MSQEFARPFADAANALITGQTPFSVENVSLSEKPRNAPIQIWGHASVFPQIDGRLAFISLLTNPDRLDRMNQLRTNIPTLDLPQRVQRINRPSSPIERNFVTEACRALGLPIVLLAGGTYPDTDQTAYILFLAPGYTPREGLQLIKDRFDHSKTTRN